MLTVQAKQCTFWEYASLTRHLEQLHCSVLFTSRELIFYSGQGMHASVDDAAFIVNAMQHAAGHCVHKAGIGLHQGCQSRGWQALPSWHCSKQAHDEHRQINTRWSRRAHSTPSDVLITGSPHARLLLHPASVLTDLQVHSSTQATRCWSEFLFNCSTL